DEFLEYAEYVGNFYGTPKQYVDAAMDEGRDVILDIEIQGAMQVKHKRPETVSIFIAPPSWEELERRLTARGTDTSEKIRQRLLRAKVEVQNAHAYEYFVVNDTVENAVGELSAIITAEHCKPSDRMEILA
ncbi:MAG: guanylate kinase, partial [Oscillibacter sp.]|nr:guanylate kinase [Oscillibacter sp.]